MSFAVSENKTVFEVDKESNDIRLAHGFRNRTLSRNRRALSFTRLREHLQIFIVHFSIRCGHVSDVKANDPEQTFSFGAVPGSESRVSHSPVRKIDFDFQFVLEGNRVIANYMKLPGLDCAGLNSHSLSSEIERKPVDDSRAMPLVALIYDGQPQRKRLRRRRDLALTLAFFEFVGVLYRANQLQPVKAAKSILIGEKPPAGRTLFHGTLSAPPDYTSADRHLSLVISHLSLVH